MESNAREKRKETDLANELNNFCQITIILKDFADGSHESQIFRLHTVVIRCQN